MGLLHVGVQGFLRFVRFVILFFMRCVRLVRFFFASARGGGYGHAYRVEELFQKPVDDCVLRFVFFFSWRGYCVYFLRNFFANIGFLTGRKLERALHSRK